MLRRLLLLLLLALAPLPARPPEEGKAVPPPKKRGPSFGAIRARPLGPGLYSGRISALAVDPRRPSRWYVGAASGGVWKTENAGATWTPIFDGQKSYSIGAVVLDPRNPDTVWVGTGENNAQRSVGYGDGVYRSDDGGKSWKHLGLPKSEHIGRIAIDPRDSRTVYVAAQGPLWADGGERGLYKTVDGGKSWTRLLGDDTDQGATDVVLDPENPDRLLAATHQRRRHVWTMVHGGPKSALWRSLDGGKTWDKAKGLPAGDLGRIGLAFAPSRPSTAYATVEAPDGKGGVFRSADGGATWERRNPFDEIAMYYSHLVVDPKDAERLHVMNVRVMSSSDGGKTLAPLPLKHVHVDHHCLWIDPADTAHMILGNDGGLYETRDGAANWRHFGNLPLTQFYDVAVGGSGPFYRVYGGTQDNNTVGGPARTRNAHGIENGDWSVLHPGDGFQCKADPEEPHVVYAEAQYGDLVRYDARTGESVGIQPKPARGEPPLRWNWDSPLVLSRHQRKRLYFGANILYRSEDRGDTWEAISPDLTRKLDRDKLPVMGKMWSVDAVGRHKHTSFFGNLTALAESPQDEKTLYAGTDDGLVHATRDGGKTWARTERFPGVAERAYVARVAASRHAAGRVWAVFNNHKAGDFKSHLLRSDDHGKTWARVALDLDEPLWCLAECPKDAGLLFAGSEFGLHVSLDGGQAWQPLKAGLPPIPVRDLAIHEGMGDLVVGTFGRGIWVIDDYAPLRSLKEGTRLFPPRAAHLHIPARPLGYSGKGSRGEAFWTAENPAFGAALAYQLAETLKTRKERRQDREKAGKIDAPTLDELRAEAEEEAPAAVLEVREGDKVVRRIEGPARGGAHRAAWDLRDAAGQLVGPGKFTVRLLLRHEGKEEPVGEPQPLAVVGEGDHAPRLAHQAGLESAAKSLNAALSVAKELEGTLAEARRALERAKVPAEKERRESQALQGRLRAVLLALRGETALAS
ncbi:MAG: hypothetical protein K2W96_12425, partial [Gemmataceae bacterium]|nr:hypothetical protein [Gemmataceae bacterium]